MHLTNHKWLALCGSSGHAVQSFLQTFGFPPKIKKFRGYAAKSGHVIRAQICFVLWPLQKTRMLGLALCRTLLHLQLGAELAGGRCASSACLHGTAAFFLEGEQIFIRFWEWKNLTRIWKVLKMAWTIQKFMPKMQKGKKKIDFFFLETKVAFILPVVKRCLASFCVASHPVGSFECEYSVLSTQSGVLQDTRKTSKFSW